VATSSTVEHAVRPAGRPAAEHTLIAGAKIVAAPNVVEYPAKGAASITS
jgi:hypothetical protein